MRASWTDALRVKHRRWLCREEMVVDIVEVEESGSCGGYHIEVDTVVVVVVSREEEKVELMRMEM
ncbi:hypothetical protein DY000_02025732 [Brassica cretica]|uniref:Uncharacterized protein n=1 Tax=Brassica cretica TaxID=69181 RepID=A0ABQ7E302_BRACR|nr:hypothetical protein DY000_02025732 [Brassica cretica]